MELMLNEENKENLELFQNLLKKEKSVMINEALHRYFSEEMQRIQDEDSSQTNLSYEEFWDDVDI